MKTTRIIELMEDTRSLLVDILRDYSKSTMTPERIELVASAIDVLDSIKEIKVEMREGLENRSLRERNGGFGVICIRGKQAPVTGLYF